jgi:hypothetical protein
MRAMLLIYSGVNVVVWFKMMVFGPLNWTIRLRTCSVLNDKTLSDSGSDYTHTAVPTDFTDLAPTFPGSSFSHLAHSLCGPSRYLYLLTPPISAKHARITSVHIFIFGSISNEGGEDVLAEEEESSEWFECAVLRHMDSESSTLTEVPDAGRFPISLRFRAKDAKNRRPYAAVHSMNLSEPLTRALRHGDMIALWAKGRIGHIHRPAMAMIKVLVQRALSLILVTESVGVLDINAASHRLP